MQSPPSTYSIRGFRQALASINSVPQFAVLGVASGIVTGLAILAFRSLIELPLSFLLKNSSENFEGLPWPFLFMLPVAGGIVLALLFALLPVESRRVGVVHVLERLRRYQGHLPLPNAITQFLGGIIALVTGQSGGTEGPAIHLGAACSSLVGQSLKLPNNSIRILVGCGAAAAISASFNTPIAGVIFSMEVIIMEYTIVGFIPVILAAVIANLINQTLADNLTVFSMPLEVTMNSFYNLPFVIVEGILIGIVAALFVRLIQSISRVAPKPDWLRLLIAGIVTGTIALISPEVLGVGYDTVYLAHSGQLALTILVIACIAKFVATATTIALGVPVGVIGPTLFIGATAGGILGYFSTVVLPTDLVATPGFYVLLGMGAMMGAVLQAPLAALMAVMELSHNPDIILPAMLVIIIANMTASQVFNVKSVFLTQMEIMGLEFTQTPLSMALNRASMASVMSRSFERVACRMSREQALEAVKEKPIWLLTSKEPQGSPASIVLTADLIQFLDTDSRSEIDLDEIPALRKDVTGILLQATLSEALDTLNNSGVQALYINRISINRISAPMIDSVVGIVTREDIESFYQEQFR